MDHLESIKAALNDKDDFQLKTLPTEKTALIIVDVINGFIFEGNLSCKSISKIINPIKNTLSYFKENNMKAVAFCDSHSEKSLEFSDFPPHCIAGTSEPDVVDDLKSIGGYYEILKNSTNGFHEAKFQEWLKENSHIDNFIIVGDCTDICVLQFSLSLKTFFNNINKPCNVIVPMNSVDTFDLPGHPSEFYNLISLDLMSKAGIKIVKSLI